PWSAETPNLYVLEATLEDGTGAPLHRLHQRFGFRTIEVRLEGRGPVDQESPPGVYVNGRRVLLRGVNRHSFWPDTGRAGSPARNLADVEKLKSLNLNAVRTSHYPPDRDFLDACDELGIYVIDELPGWHDAYDAVVGASILRAMLRRDRNHPSVILWANGNEGGWNRRLDARFADQDPQGRPVLHPDEDFGGFDTKHYPTFEDLRARLAEPAPGGTRSLVLPTEWLHGLYDGGGGAGLGAYWEAMRTSRRGAGGFLWSFTDEAIARTDRDGALDHHGNFAPDGILGPWREETGSSAAVREIFAPVRLLAVVTEEGAPISDAAGHHHAHPMAGESRPSPAAAPRPGSGREMLAHSSATESRRPAVLLHIENRTETLDLDAFTFTWRHSRIPGPLAVEEPSPRVLASGVIEGPPSRPGERAWLAVEANATSPPATARADDTLALDVLEIHVTEDAARGGREIARWALPLGSDPPQGPDPWPASAGDSEDPEDSAITPRDGFLEVRAGGTAARFDAARGTLSSLERDGIVLPLHGVVALDDENSAASRVAARRTASGDVLDVAWTAIGALREASWRVDASGWLHLRYRLESSGPAAASGIAFTGLARKELRRLDWTGGGPFRAWGNRLEGVTLGRWSLEAGQDEPLSWVSNELEGARSGVRWLSIELETGRLIVVPRLRPQEGEDLRAPPGQAPPGAPFVWLSTPIFPEGSRGAVAELTSVLDAADTLAVLHRLPSIGTKFHAAAEISPAGPFAEEVVEGEVALFWQPREPGPSSPIPITQ
ncbi:MAG TPA: glycoside hydrolase family 2 TIM barrel-domain containing protein, partial [Thermoanaerobaculia bacterium]|nr:glycoside hydrolase family 2 TIM barrel-domain containing protein [Thermoanaerobaculia bacterium]